MEFEVLKFVDGKYEKDESFKKMAYKFARALKKQLFLKLLQKRKDCSFNGCNLFFF